ncbi:hypothetical protein [Mesorhizobium mediterraneum]|uniref:hypothetical protein n=1 Tax=Mesorhizobium mediterraneum TaxID=43617 RepID=UPI003D7C8F77
MVGGAILVFAPSFDETMIPIRHAEYAAGQAVGDDAAWFLPDINALVALILMFTVLLSVLAARFLIPDRSRRNGI